MQRTAPKVDAKERRQARGSLSFEKEEMDDWAPRGEGEEESDGDDDIEDEREETQLSNLQLKMAGVWTDEMSAGPLKKPIKKTGEETMNEMLGQRDTGKGTYQRLIARLRARAEPAEAEEDIMKQLLARGGGDQEKLLQLMVLQVMKKLVDKEDEDGDWRRRRWGKAFKRVQALRALVFKNPQQVVSEYFMKLTEKMGVEEGDAWQVWQWTGKISWGKFKGLHRVHYHLGHALTLSLRGQHQESQAYVVQLLRAIHQVSFEGGGWEIASVLLPKSDPVQRELFGGKERELEAAVAYQESLRKLKKPMQTEWTGKGDWSKGDGKGKKGDGKNTQPKHEKEDGGAGN